MSADGGSLLRARDGRESGKVDMVELFFDLVFVFAITQLSHRLLEHLDPLGAAQTGLLLLAVWWVWIYTTWVTNWLDPARVPVRLALFALMLAGLLMSASVPDAFGDGGATFALAYVSMQVGRTLFFLWAVRGEAVNMRRNFQRILVWLSLSGALWLTGGFAEGDARLGWWAAALLVELFGPVLYFHVPGRGRSSTRDWNIDADHMAERCALFIILSLGESLLITGATFAGLPWSASACTAFVAAVVGSIAMWWIYFDTGAARAHHRMLHSDDPGRHARLAYTYLHAVIVAGIIVSAVADELVLAHPDHGDTAAYAAILGGPALFLLGAALFKWVTNDRPTPPLSHLAGLAMLAAVAVPVFVPALAHRPSPLATAVLAVAALVLTAVWENIALRRPARAP